MISSRIKACLLLFFSFAQAVVAQTLYTPEGDVYTSSNGNVGIGIAAPPHKLSVGDGLLGVSDTTSGPYAFIRGSSVASYFGSDDGRRASFGNSDNWETLTVDGGNVGIGSVSPGGKLEVYDLIVNGGDNRAIRLDSDIAVTAGTGTYYNMGLAVLKTKYNIPSGVIANGYQRGIDIRAYVNDTNFQGTISDQTSLFVENGIYVAGSSGPRTITNSYGIYLSSLTNAGTITNLYGLYQASSLARNYFAGSVGIGTSNPTHKLSVNGTIRAKEIIIDTGWADYVFADDYRLAPLDEVEAHIKQHRHLPGIPSAAEVAEQGVSLGEMQSRILAKVEELTLHLIELKKENQELRRELQTLKAEASQR